MPCQFKDKLYNYECDASETDILKSGLCIFHDKKYLKDRKHMESRGRKITRKLTEKIEKCFSENKPLVCIEYHLSEFISTFKCFSIQVNFSRAVFNGPVNFSETQFKNEADFSQTQFKERADFSEAQFTKKAHFAAAEFTKEADFTRARFAEKADFYNTDFGKKAIFFEAQFADNADFKYARFANEVSFMDAQFTKEAYFNQSEIAGSSFWKTRFTKEADFSIAKFTRGASFTGTQFEGKADFSETRFTEKADFQNVQFEDQEHTFFLTDDLTHVSFVNTDISRVKFGENVMWGEKFKILEEREIETMLANNDIVQSIQRGNVLAVYRNLRENYEFRLRYDEAGEFFIREMEMKRKYKEVSFRKKEESPKDGNNVENKNDQQTIVEIRRNHWIVRNFSLTGLYYHLSRYGQSFSRPALFGVGIVLLSTLLWLTQPDPTARDYSITNFTLPVINNSSNLVTAFERSITNFLPNLSFGTETGAGLIDFAFKIVGGAVTFGLIIIALRRKFERKFRH